MYFGCCWSCNWQLHIIVVSRTTFALDSLLTHWSRTRRIVARISSVTVAMVIVITATKAFSSILFWRNVTWSTRTVIVRRVSVAVGVGLPILGRLRLMIRFPQSCRRSHHQPNRAYRRMITWTVQRLTQTIWLFWAATNIAIVSICATMENRCSLTVQADSFGANRSRHALRLVNRSVV